MAGLSRDGPLIPSLSREATLARLLEGVRLRRTGGSGASGGQGRGAPAALAPGVPTCEWEVRLAITTGGGTGCYGDQLPLGGSAGDGGLVEEARVLR